MTHKNLCTKIKTTHKNRAVLYIYSRLTLFSNKKQTIMSRLNTLGMQFRCQKVNEDDYYIYSFWDPFTNTSNALCSLNS